MTTLTCPQCSETQEVAITVDTYVVVCERCGTEFKIPREHRINKREIQEHTSRVNIRIGYREAGGTLTVGWTVQSAEKGNQYLERDSIGVDVSDHPQKTHWYVAVFKALQHVNAYKSARIWIKHELVIEHLSGDVSIPDDDLRAQLVTSITDLCDEKFYGCEFAVANSVGPDIKRLIS